MGREPQNNYEQLWAALHSPLNHPALTETPDGYFWDGARVYRVAAAGLARRESKIAKMSRRAARLGVAAPTLRTVHQELLWEQLEPSLARRAQTWFYVLPPGAAPVLAGWKFLGVLEHAGAEIGTLVRAVPGETIPTRYFTAQPGTCDHCHTLRRRNETFIVQHETGATQQVGRQCVADFLGGADPAQHLAQLEMLCHLADELALAEAGAGDYYGGRSEGTPYPLGEVLAVTSAAIRNVGWCSRSQSKSQGGAATADEVAKFFRRQEQLSRTQRQLMSPQSRDEELAGQALAWVRRLSAAERERDYLHNIFVLSKGEIIDVKHFGLGCSIVAAFLRHQERLLAQAAQAAALVGKTNGHFGTPGAKPAHFTLQCTGYTTRESEYGVKYIFTFEDGDGRLATWCGSGAGAAALDYDQALGQTFHIRAKVKEHGTYRQRAQTVLSHLKVVTA